MIITLKIKKRCKLVFVLMFIVAVIVAIAINVNLKIRSYAIESEKISQTVRLLLITDLHSCKYGDEQSELIKAIEEQKPDVVLFGGDICDDEISNDNIEFLLKGIASEYPCYYVTGNHEYWSKDIESVLNLFKNYNVKILSGTYDTVEINNQKINICGVTDPNVILYTDSEYGVPQQLESLKNIHNNGYYTILLSHRPEEINTYAKYNFDLVLSGHAHGGQWCMPGIINGLYAPDQGWFPQYAGGKYTVGNAIMIVSRGLARESTRVPRIFNRPELVVVDLKSTLTE